MQSADKFQMDAAAQRIIYPSHRGVDNSQLLFETPNNLPHWKCEEFIHVP